MIDTAGSEIPVPYQVDLVDNSKQRRQNSIVMAIDIETLKQRYLSSCRSHGIIPNDTILSAFFKVGVKKTCQETCNLELILDHLKDIDVCPLLEVLMDVDASEIEAVDVHNESSCILNGEYALSLIRAVNHKLRIVDLRDISFGRDFLRDLSHRGLMCEALYLRSSHFHKLGMTGKFTRIHTLNLDFSTMLTSFHEDCFTSMPNLMFLSMCETGVSNLWTTISALSKLPRLAELRFQKWLHSDDPEPFTRSCIGKLGNSSASSVEVGQITEHCTSPTDILRNLFSLGGVVINQELHSAIEESADESEVESSRHRQEYGFMDPSFDSSPQWSRSNNLNTEVNCWFFSQDEGSADACGSGCILENASKYISYFASPICFERHYREYMIASLPNLSILDNLPIGKFERERAAATYSQYFEFLPYRRKAKESVLNVLHNREIRSSHTHFCNIKNKVLCPTRTSRHFYTRSLSAAKVASSPWPSMHPISFSNNISGHENHTVRPRQFEYHPSDCGLMVVGTLDGEVFVINHETGRTVSYIPSLGAMSSVLGLCWLKKYPSMLIAGSDNGSLRLYDIQPMPITVTGMHQTTFDDFDQLTSVHVNSSDELFLASGYSKNVALYDIGSRRRLQVFTDMHREHINVVKFANHSPFLFATSSFDRDIRLWDLRQKPIQPCYTATSSKGNVMVCFSPDDHYLLASAVDNEVKQLLAVDGRVHMDFSIAPTGSSQNYTRSYYLNGRDYIISGSCDEHVVRICCAQTGRRLRDISLEGKGLGTSMYVQSLRGDPFRDFNMSILAADVHLGSKSEIVKVNLLASNCYGRKSSSTDNVLPSICMGG